MADAGGAMSAVIAHVCGAIVPASAAMAAAVRDGDALGAAAADAPLARWLAGARHHPRPSVTRPAVMVVAADHGVLDPGPSLGADHPTAIALAAIAAGDAAIASLARGAGAHVVVIDAGVAIEATAAIGVVPWRATADLVTRAAMTPAMARAALEGGIAAATALVEDGTDLLILGAVGVGGDVAAAAVIAALTGDDPPAADDDVRALVQQAVARIAPPVRQDPLAVLAELGGGDLGVLAGAMLTAAALHVPVIVDGVVALAGALIACTLAPATAGYLLAAHAGGGPAAGRARAALRLTPMIGYGLGRGDGAGGALALPVVLAAARKLGA